MFRIRTLTRVEARLVPHTIMLLSILLLSGAASVEASHDPKDKKILNHLELISATHAPPYPKCKGECQSHRQCEGRLECFDRRGMMKVPGCTGTRVEDFVGYCYDPADGPNGIKIPLKSDELLYIGNDLGVPLGKCVGDCRVDMNCLGDLRCFEKKGPTVPGCSGVRENGVDYCYDPKDADDNPNKDAVAENFPKNSDVVTFVGQEPKDPIGRCQGDCDIDGDCRGDLICFAAPNEEMTVPGCDGSRLNNIDYCMDANDLPKNGKKLIKVSDNPDTKLGACLGHCSKDSDCRDDLVCFDPKGKEEIPGCKEGRVVNGVNYCVASQNGGGTKSETVANKPQSPPEQKTTLDPTDMPSREPTLDPTDMPSREPTLEPTDMPSRKPTSAPTVTPGNPTGTPTIKPTQRPTTPEPSAKPFQQGKIFVQLSPFVIELSFLTPQRRLAAGPTQGRHLLINENLHEDGELLNIVAKIVGDEIRKIDPQTFLGLLFNVMFLEEINVEGTTSVSYEFIGKAIFANEPGIQLPSRSELEAASVDALDESVLQESLRKSGDPVLETVDGVLVYTAEEAYPDNLSKQSDGDPPSSGIKTGVIVLICVVFACVALIGGAYFYMRKRNIKPTWKRPRREQNDVYEKKQVGGIASVMTLSKSFITSLPSPVKTKSTFDSHDNPNPDHVHVDYEPSELSLPEFDEASSIDGPGSSDWSFNGLSSTDDASFVRKNKSSRMPTTGPLARASGIAITDTVNGSEDQGHVYRYSEGSVSDSASTADNMSALGEVRLGSVLQIDEDDDANKPVNGGNASEDKMDFQEVWRRSRRLELSIEEQIFGTSKSERALHVSQSHSTDAEEILKNVDAVEKASTGQESLTTPERTGRQVVSPSSNPEEEVPI